MELGVDRKAQCCVVCCSTSMATNLLRLCHFNGTQFKNSANACVVGCSKYPHDLGRLARIGESEHGSKKRGSSMQTHPSTFKKVLD